MYELSNGDIVQFKAYNEDSKEHYKLINGEKRYLYHRRTKMWYTEDDKPILGLHIKKELQ